MNNTVMSKITPYNITHKFFFYFFNVRLPFLPKRKILKYTLKQHIRKKTSFYAI